MIMINVVWLEVGPGTTGVRDKVVPSGDVASGVPLFVVGVVLDVDAVVVVAGSALGAINANKEKCGVVPHNMLSSSVMSPGRHDHALRE